MLHSVEGVEDRTAFSRTHTDAAVEVFTVLVLHLCHSAGICLNAGETLTNHQHVCFNPVSTAGTFAVIS